MDIDLVGLVFGCIFGFALGRLSLRREIKDLEDVHNQHHQHKRINYVGDG